jgi:hypothetical protein
MVARKLVEITMTVRGYMNQGEVQHFQQSDESAENLVLVSPSRVVAVSVLDGDDAGAEDWTVPEDAFA